jgi:hypothetical protein
VNEELSAVTSGTAVSAGIPTRLPIPPRQRQTRFPLLARPSPRTLLEWPLKPSLQNIPGSLPSKAGSGSARARTRCVLEFQPCQCARRNHPRHKRGRRTPPGSPSEQRLRAYGRFRKQVSTRKRAAVASSALRRKVEACLRWLCTVCSCESCCSCHIRHTRARARA